MVHMDAWLRKVDEIAAEGPSYQLGHDDTDGKCDCIGLDRLNLLSYIINLTQEGPHNGPK